MCVLTYFFLLVLITDLASFSGLLILRTLGFSYFCLLFSILDQDFTHLVVFISANKKNLRKLNNNHSISLPEIVTHLLKMIRNSCWHNFISHRRKPVAVDG